MITVKMIRPVPLNKTKLILPFLRKLTPTLEIASVRTFNYNNPRKVQTVAENETKNSPKEKSFFSKLLSKSPFFNIERSKIMAAGYLGYEGIADNVDYIQFFRQFDLPDTFYSWFVVTELHIWMMSVRAMAEGDEGRLYRNSLVEALWADVAQRVKKLGANNPAVTRVQVSLLSEQFQAALIGYDEGLLTDDIVLASAAWRRFYQYRNVDLRRLDQLVKYIRNQIKLLDNLPKGYLFEKKEIPWDSPKD